MPSFARGQITSVLRSRKGLQRVELADGSAAVAFTDLCGEVRVDDEVLVNTTAVELGLGTGGVHVVHTNLSRPYEGLDGGGHIMKARYLAEQIDAGSWEEHGTFAPDVPSLAGVRVALCVLHSHVGALATALGSVGGAAPGYVMTDQAALPFVLSDLAAELCERGLLGLTVSAGQAFGAELEAVSVASGVHAMAERGIDVVIVAAGPGHVGTASPLGFSSLELAGHAAVLGALGAEVSLVVRASSADRRSRHRGVSHHTTTLLGLIQQPVVVPVPSGAATDWVTELGHLPIDLAPIDVAQAMNRSGVDVATMGRRLVDDGLALDYLGAAAAWLRR